ncbi:MAG: methyltransferase family protein [Alphaproteobacteria bacterium]
MSRYSRSFNNNSGLLLITLVAIIAEPTWQLDGWVEESAEWAGSLLIAVCALGRIWCTAYIGGKKNRELVNIGPYSVVRNPLYVFNTIGVVGIGLLTGMFVFCLAVAAVFAVYNGWVIRREEDKLSAAFGPDYEAYLRRVPRWLPDPSLWRQPDLLHVNANLLMISIRDASVFFLALPALELLKQLHETGILPALIDVW